MPQTGGEMLLESLAMVILRTVVGVITGDLIFVVSAAIFFYLTHTDPHVSAKPGFMAVSIIYGVFFALLGGYVAGLISRRSDLIAGMILAAIIGLGATASLVGRPGAGAIWSQTAALLAMAPAALVGDWMRKTRRAAS